MNENETDRESSKALDAIAIEWVARADRGSLDAEAAHELGQWLAISSRHRGAYAKAQATLAYLDANILSTDDTKESLSSFFAERDLANTGAARHVSRRRLMWIGGGVGLAAAASLAAVMFKTEAPATVYASQRGEILRVPLADGSLITLDTASTVAVRYDNSSRNIELMAGRASFDVAKDKSRPFIVTAASLQVRAVGTSFVVRNTVAGPPDVLVREGVVDVGQQTDSNPVRVGANTRVIASASGPALNVVSVDAAAVSYELAWQRGILEYRDASLAVIAEDYRRYSEMRIIIPDPKISARTISGRFSANDPLSFARAAALSFGLKLNVKEQEIELLSSQ